jgi:hypothetical protein
MVKPHPEEEGIKWCGHYGATCATALYWCKTYEPDGWGEILEEKHNCKGYNLDRTIKIEWNERYGYAFCKKSMSYIKCNGKRCKFYKKKMKTVDDL